jgi:hypothetical protein
MIRKVVTLTLALTVAHPASLILENTGVLRPMASARGADLVAPGARPVLRDTFDDNAAGAIWQVVADQPDFCTMKEANKRLELQATRQSVDGWASYIANGWRLNPRQNFSAKVDYYYDLVSDAEGWISLGITTNPNSPWEENAVVGVGCVDGFPHFWYRKQTGSYVSTSFSQRWPTSGTLYVSYDAAADVLYLSLCDYSAQNAWETMAGLVKEEWGGQPVYVWLAGGSNGLTVPSGRAYLDNFVLDTGTTIEESLKDVYRFWSPSLDRYFYTISESERGDLLANFASVWNYEGVVYRAYIDDADPNVSPVYRFWSNSLKGHFYTIDESERNRLINQYSYVWTYEGVAFYAYPVGKQPSWARPVYRFWSPAWSTHFYTISEAEKASMQTKHSDIWTYEGIAWYASE